MYEPEQIRNIGICAHIDHGKTTLSDNLLAGAGMISEELAGDQRFLDFDEQEQARGITIDAANVSMVHDYKDSEYLINLIDTPGHVDFGGDVTRAMRAVDGAVVVVCAVEGIMPQTETVFRQALKENVKPVLFINKVDRLINELKLEPEELQNRFLKIFMEANKLIRNMAPEDKKEEWKLDFTDGSVAFGSAYHNWAINVPTMQETGINFKDIIDYCNAENQKELAQKVPLSDVLLGMVVEHLPSPKEAQVYRVPNIWDGDIESPAGEGMVTTSADGPLAVMVTNVSVDKHAGEIATGRVYGGSIEKGTEVYLVGSHGKSRVQQVGVYFGPERVNTDKVPAGNIVYVAGAKGAIAGETLCSPEDKIKEFEGLEHISEPVVTVAVEAKNTKDLPKLIEVLRQTAKEDPTIHVNINEETGEHLVSGMGELHLEVEVERMRREFNVDCNVGKPQVAYRESITTQGPFNYTHKKQSGGSGQYGRVAGFMEPITEKDYEFVNSIKGGAIPNEFIPSCDKGFQKAMKEGSLIGAPIVGVKMTINDGQSHPVDSNDNAFQIAAIGAFREGYAKAKPVILEPIMKVQMTAPTEFQGNLFGLINQRRGVIVDSTDENNSSTVNAEVPLSEMFGFSTILRSSTQGKGEFTMEFEKYGRVPNAIAEELIKKYQDQKKAAK